MNKYFYFRDVADEVNDDDISASVAIPVDAICGVVPVAITTLEVYYKKEGVVQNQKVTLTVTRGKLQEVMQQIVEHVNGYTHSKAPLTVMGDMTTTTHGTSSVEGNDKVKSAVLFSNHVTAVAIAAAAY
jgi:hypothetical protein